MSRVVDTCILIDILENDPDFVRASVLCLRDFAPRLGDLSDFDD